jgi:alkanesulfonate monooxygenase SsuD/methylene tetrahydromethanopterin reductase-like flavin-dependent oxidoreductase (luciferase family)
VFRTRVEGTSIDWQRDSERSVGSDIDSGGVRKGKVGQVGTNAKRPSAERAVRFGVQFRNFPSDLGDSLFDRMAEISRECESLGFDGLFMIDHLMLRPPISYESQAIPECWNVLAYIAARTSSVRLGSLVSCVPFRSEAYLANLCLTLIDILGSPERLIVGLGSGWFEDEFKAYGIPCPLPKARLAELRQTVVALRQIFDARVGALGHQETDHPAFSAPKVWIGGSGESLTLRAVAKLADACSLFGDVEAVYRKLALLDSFCAVYGRDPRTLTRSKHSNVVFATNEDRVRFKMRKIISNEKKWNDFERANIVGTPEQCLSQIAAYWRAGITYFTLSFPDLFEIEPLREFSELVIRRINQEIMA